MLSEKESLSVAFGLNSQRINFMGRGDLAAWEKYSNTTQNMRRSVALAAWPLLRSAAGSEGARSGGLLHKASHTHRVGRRVQSLDEWHAVRQRRPRRPYDRALETAAEESAPVTTGIGTHFAYVWVGSPTPQRQTVILDTGSYHTGFPCDPCTDCGDYEDYHESGPFVPANSATYTATVKAYSCSVVALCVVIEGSFCIYTTYLSYGLNGN